MPDLKKIFTHPDYEHEPVPVVERQNMWDIVFVWIGFVATMGSLMLGLRIGLSLTFWNLIWAILLSIVILVGVEVLTSIIGQKTGLTFSLAIRHVFGKYGMILPAGIMGLVLLGWIGFDIAWAPGFAQGALGWNFILLCVIITIIYTVTGYIGWSGLMWLSRITMPVFIILCLVYVWAAIGKVGVSGILAFQPDKPMPFAAAVGSLVGLWYVGAMTALDVNRFAKSVGQTVHACWIGMGVVRPFITLAGALAAMAYGTANPGAILAEFGFWAALLGFILIFLIMWTTTDNAAYSSALAFAGINRRLSKKVLVVGIMIFGLVTAAAGILGIFLQYLLFIGAIVPPIAGVLIADFWVVQRGSKQTESGAKLKVAGWRWSAVVTWLLATGLAIWFTVIKLPWAFLWVLLIAFVLHIVLSRIIKEPVQRVPGW